MFYVYLYLLCIWCLITTIAVQAHRNNNQSIQVLMTVLVIVSLPIVIISIPCIFYIDKYRNRFT